MHENTNLPNRGYDGQISELSIDNMITELTLEEKAGLCSGSDFWHTRSVERLGIPKVMMCDGPHGLRKQKGEGDHLGINESIEAVCFPTATALASSFDRGLLHQLGETLGGICQTEDVGMLLGPGLNIKRSPLCGRNFEYFSEDPYLSGELGAAYVNGLQGKGVAACIKHFAANNQETRRMSSDSQLDERTLHEIYLPAFETVVKDAKVRSVMCSYNKINGIFLAENKKMLTDILRGKWGFEGFVVTDWGAVKDRMKGLEAGLDLEMPGGRDIQTRKIVAAVKDGSLDEKVLDQAVCNILKFIKEYQIKSVSGTPYDGSRDRNFAAQVAKESAVLLTNPQGILPLSKTMEIAFIGDFAHKPRYQGAGSSFINVPHTVSALQEVNGLPVVYAQGYRAADDELDQVLIEEAVRVASKAEVAVIFAGLPDTFETEGVDRESMDMPVNQTKLIEAITAVQPNTVVVMHGGAPVIMPWIDQVSAVLHMHLGGERVGEAAAALLFGEANPSGKLAETYPMKLADNPSYLSFPGERGVVEYREGIYVGYRYYDKKEMAVRFPFGHGLSYTSFEYSDLVADKTCINDDETLKVSCKVRNTGNHAGKEVVQLYVKDVQSTVGRPIRELKGFDKVALAPGEEKTVIFTLNKRSFAYYEPAIADWYVESGEFTIDIGASSRDIRLSTIVVVRGTSELQVHYTRESTIGDLMLSEHGRSVMASMGQLQGNDGESGDSSKYMGEGSKKMVETMMKEMPLSSLINFGRMSEEQLGQLLSRLNHNS